MVGAYETRSISALASLQMALNALRRTSNVIGSLRSAGAVAVVVAAGSMWSGPLCDGLADSDGAAAAAGPNVDDDVQVPVDFEARARRDEDGRVVLLDDHRPL